VKYSFLEIEKKWQKFWSDNRIYEVKNSSTKPKFYVLDMFPYPSGAGLHVGHPLGYIASDIFSRYKRHKGYNVLHPQGMILLDYLLSNMLLQLVNIPKKLHQII